MVSTYLTAALLAGAGVVLYKREELLSYFVALGSRPVTYEGATSDGFCPLWEADGLHPFEAFALHEKHQGGAPTHH